MNIYVGNIPWSTSEEELETHFAQFGNVNAAQNNHRRVLRVDLKDLDLLRWSQKLDKRLLKLLTELILGEEISESTKLTKRLIVLGRNKIPFALKRNFARHEVWQDSYNHNFELRKNNSFSIPRRL